MGYHSVRKPNHYVRNITHSMKKNTYVLPDALKSQLSVEDTGMLTKQLQALPETLAEGVLDSLSHAQQKYASESRWLDAGCDETCA